MKRRVAYVLVLALLVLLIGALPALAGDPSGGATGGKADFDFLYAGKALIKAGLSRTES